MGCAEHERVYSGEAFTTYPAQYAWICSRCLEEGVEHLRERPLFDPALYADVLERKRPGDPLIGILRRIAGARC